MRTSRIGGGRLAIVLGVVVVAWLAGCAALQRPAPLPACALPAGLTPTQVSLADDLQRAAVVGPLFAETMGLSGVAACRVEAEGGAVAVQYRAVDGSALRMSRREAAEHSEVEARLIAPPIERPDTLLRRAERAAFGDAGCGIDWHRPRTLRSTADPNGVDTVYRGETCNCQAIERRDGNGVVVGLAFTSAC